MTGSLCIGLLVVFYCGAQPQTVTREYCQVARIISPARADTALTKRQVLTHNAKYRRLCGQRTTPGK